MKGTAIIAAFILIVIGTLIVGGYLLYISRESNMTVRNSNSIRALYIAEAGLERAISDLALDADWFNDEINGWSAVGINTLTFIPVDYDALGPGYNASFGGGEYLLEVIKVTNTMLRLRSTGTINNETRIITEEVYRQTIFDWAAFGNEGVHLGSNVQIDSYNSGVGAYDPANPGTNGDTGTNAIGTGVISLDSNAKIYGDAVVGPGGNPDTDITLGSNALITGTQEAQESQTELPQISPPDGLIYRGAISLGSNDTLTISASGQYDSISLSSNSAITIDADVIIYITGALSMNSNSRIDIVNNAEAIFYVGGSFSMVSMDSNTSINNPSNDPSAFTLYGLDTLTNISFDSNATIYGSVYTRQADFTMDSNSYIYGSLVAKSITLGSNAKIHYDESLAGTGPSTGQLKAIAWQEVY